MKKKDVLKVSIIVGVIALAIVSMACGLLSLGSYLYRDSAPGQPNYGEPRFEEPMFEEPRMEEPFFEEPRHEEPMFEEPRPEEPMPQEPLPPEPQPQSQQPQPQQPQPQQPAPKNSAANAQWATDFAITDIYPGKMPYGQFWFRITNHGPKTASNVQVPVVCNAASTNYFNGTKGNASTGTMNIKVNLKPGETKEYATGLKLDTKNFWYQVTCQIQGTPLDSNPGNNQYSETVPPPP